MSKEVYVGYVMTPAWAMRDSRLNERDKLLIGIITGLSSEYGYCWASNEYIEENYNFSRHKIQESLKRLTELKLVKRVITRKKSDKFKSERRLYITYNSDAPASEKSDAPEHPKNRTLTASEKSDVDIKDYIKEDIKECTHASEILDQFIELTDEISSDNRYMGAGRRPLKKYPDIWLSPTELKDTLDSMNEADIPAKEVFKKVAQRFVDYKAARRSVTTVSAHSWLNGWAKVEVLKDLKALTDLKRSQSYLNGVSR